MNARAAVLVAPRAIELREFPLPEIGVEDALLRVEACGLCGTDYEQWLGHVQNWGRMPIIPGHEVMGWIDRIGVNAAQRWNVREGDRVAVEPIVPCGHCASCAEGAYTRCASDVGYGLYRGTEITPSLWGGYATHMYLHPRTMLHKLPASASTETIGLFNPLSNAVRWIYDVGGVGLGTRVVIAGPGQRGLLAAVVARIAGAAEIYITGTTADRERLALARTLGVTATIDVDNEDPVARVRELTGGKLTDVVLDVSSGSNKPIVQAVDMVRRGGRIVLAGLKGKKPIEGLMNDKIVFGEIELRGALSAGWHSTRTAIELLERHGKELSALCSHRFPLDQAELAVRTLGREVRDGVEPIHITLKIA
jgi:threonine dehydrogenase-like Zn-dependent dehydrogenase